MIEPLAPNTKIGHFIITEYLNQGGFGITYRAKDTQLDADVVLKEAIPDCECYREHTTGRLKTISENQQATFDTAQKDLYEEAQRMAKLQDRGIVEIREVISFNGSTFLVMPYLAGGSLKDSIDVERSLPEAENILRCLLKTLSYIHKEGFLHRDIKPDNILFDNRGEPVLIDLGSMHHFARTTTSPESYTPDYAAPEVFTSKKKEDLTPASDLYSLAATMHEIITGLAPTAAKDRLKKDGLKPLSSVRSQVDKWGKDFLDAIDKNLSLEPKKRMQLADKWLSVLNALDSIRKETETLNAYNREVQIWKETRETLKSYGFRADTLQALIDAGDHFYNGDHGFEQDYDKAFSCYRKAVEISDYHWAYYNVGKCYMEGHGVEKNAEEAKKWFYKAHEADPNNFWVKLRLAELGDAVMMSEVGDCYYDGRAVNQGCHRDPGIALTWYRKSADGGYHWGYHNVGKCYLEGQGIAKDDEAARQWFRKAYEMNENLWSLYWLAELGDKDAAARIPQYRDSDRLHQLLSEDDAWNFWNLTKKYADCH